MKKGNSKQSSYNVHRLKLIIKGLLPSLLSLFTPRDNKHIIFCSSYTTKFQFNSRYLFLYFLENHKDMKVEFVINDDEERNRLTQEWGPHFIETESLKGKFHALNAGIWVPSTLETPVSGLFLSFRRLVYHVGHGVPFKNFGNNEKEMSLVKKIYIQLIKTNFSYLVSNNKDFIKVMAGYIDIPEDHIVINGLPRNDSLYKKMDSSVFTELIPDLPKGARYVLYAPTWRPYAELELFPFQDLNPIELKDFLEKENIIVFMRPHPSYPGIFPPEISSVDRIRNLDASIVPEIMEILPAFDLLITDYSSIFIDWLITGKPMAFIPYDLDTYDEKIGFSVPFEKNTAGPKIDSQKSFLTELGKLLNDSDYFREERAVSNDYFNPIRVDNCRKNAEMIFSLIQKR